ncbi:hypothetical protein AB0M48_12260 [Lentzea sp. NPDC051208]
MGGFAHRTRPYPVSVGGSGTSCGGRKKPTPGGATDAAKGAEPASARKIH